MSSSMGQTTDHPNELDLSIEDVPTSRAYPTLGRRTHPVSLASYFSKPGAHRWIGPFQGRTRPRATSRGPSKISPNVLPLVILSVGQPDPRCRRSARPLDLERPTSWPTAPACRTPGSARLTEEIRVRHQMKPSGLACADNQRGFRGDVSRADEDGEAARGKLLWSCPGPNSSAVRGLALDGC